MYYFVPNIKSRVVSGFETDHFFTTRKKEGDQVMVCDQKSTKARVLIKSADKKKKIIKFDILQIETINQGKSSRVLFQAIPDKQYLDKLVEVLPLGDIDELFLFQSEFSPKYNINWDRIEKILIRSTEQCQRLQRPKIKQVDQDEIINLLNEHNPVVMDCEGGDGKEEDINNSVLVGPEGGWSRKELADFKEMGLDIIKTGELVLPAWLAGFSYFA